jgi:hypothetical protein
MRPSPGVTQGDEESIEWKTKKVRVRLEGEKRGWRRKSQGDKVRRPSPSIVSSNSSESSITTLVYSVLA